MNFGKNSEWTIEYDQGVVSDLKNIGQTDQKRIRKYISKLAEECADPRERGEPYRSYLAGFWKYRVGKFRIICQIIESNVILLCVLRVAHRSRSYSKKSIDELFKRAAELESLIGRADVDTSKD